MTARTLTTEEFAEQLGVSAWSLYQAVRRGDPPIPPVRVGRRLLWPRASVDALLGIEDGPTRPPSERDIASGGNPRRVRDSDQVEQGRGHGSAVAGVVSTPAANEEALR